MSTLKDIYKTLFSGYYVESESENQKEPSKSGVGPAFLQGESWTHL